MLKPGRGGEDGVQEQRKSCILFVHEVFQRGFPTAYGLKTLFPLGRSDWITECVWSHIDKGLAKRCGHQ